MRSKDAQVSFGRTHGKSKSKAIMIGHASHTHTHVSQSTLESIAHKETDVEPRNNR